MAARAALLTSILLVGASALVAPSCKASPRSRVAVAAHPVGIAWLPWERRRRKREADFEARQAEAVAEVEARVMEEKLRAEARTAELEFVLSQQASR